MNNAWGTRDEQEHRKKLIAIWDSVRDEAHKGCADCAGVICSPRICPIDKYAADKHGCDCHEFAWLYPLEFMRFVSDFELPDEKTDWTKVEVDTPIMACLTRVNGTYFGEKRWGLLHFAFYLESEGCVYAWADEHKESAIRYEEVRLATPEEVMRYGE